MFCSDIIEKNSVASVQMTEILIMTRISSTGHHVIVLKRDLI